ncbi:hypothetical protein NE237_004520 [Protea cynaroides]|uniref:NAD(P)H dehydrogenase (quinone) n=1 Tax=Protea cynaroides TaxID=273540 RepID=A0A9Q0KJK7_9MAGN|nr:hypothetical protein NE237_004520 [Protea cynaroides]
MALSAVPAINVVALCGSLRKASFNRGLIRSAIQIGEESIKGMKIEYVDISALPFINTDLEVGGTYPPVVEAFRQKILAADCFLFASPEYNYSVTPPLKNAIDWASRPPNVWAGKSAAIVSAGGGFGGGRAQYHLRQIGVFIDLHFINKPEFFLAAFQPPQKFDSDGNLLDAQAKENLKAVLLSLLSFTSKLNGKRQASQALPSGFNAVEEQPARLPDAAIAGVSDTTHVRGHGVAEGDHGNASITDTSKLTLPPPSADQNASVKKKPPAKG